MCGKLGYISAAAGAASAAIGYQLQNTIQNDLEKAHSNFDKCVGNGAQYFMQSLMNRTAAAGIYWNTETNFFNLTEFNIHTFRQIQADVQNTLNNELPIICSSQMVERDYWVSYETIAKTLIVVGVVAIAIPLAAKFYKMIRG